MKNNNNTNQIDTISKWCCYNEYCVVDVFKTDLNENVFQFWNKVYQELRCPSG